MDWFISSIYLALCLAYLLFAWWVMRRSKRLSLLAILGILMVLTNGIAVPFLSMTDPANVVIDSFAVSLRAYITMSLFMVVSGAFLFYLSRQPDVINEPDGGLDSRLKLFMVFTLMVGTALSLRFLILGEGMQYVGVVLQSSEGQRAHYEARSEVFETLIQETGRGVGGSGMAMGIFLPLAMTPAIYFIVQRKQYQYILIVLAAAVLISLQSLVFSHRSMLVKMVLIPTMLWILARYSRSIENKYLAPRYLWMLLLTGVILLVVFSLVYVVSDSMDIADAFSFFAYRIFVIPASIASWYYELFPDFFPFRGLSEMFSMGTIQQTDNAGITFADVSYAICGSRFNANVSFVTVAYTGFGYLGVIMVSAIVCGFAFLLDLGAWKLPSLLRAMILANGIIPILGLTSAPFSFLFTYIGSVLCLLTIRINPMAKNGFRMVSQPAQNVGVNPV